MQTTAATEHAVERSLRGEAQIRISLPKVPALNVNPGPRANRYCGAFIVNMGICGPSVGHVCVKQCKLNMMTITL